MAMVQRRARMRGQAPSRPPIHGPLRPAPTAASPPALSTLTILLVPFRSRVHLWDIA